MCLHLACVHLTTSHCPAPGSTLQLVHLPLLPGLVGTSTRALEVHHNAQCQARTLGGVLRGNTVLCSSHRHSIQWPCASRCVTSRASPLCHALICPLHRLLGCLRRPRHCTLAWQAWLMWRLARGCHCGAHTHAVCLGGPPIRRLPILRVRVTTGNEPACGLTWVVCAVVDCTSYYTYCAKPPAIVAPLYALPPPQTHTHVHQSQHSL